MNTKLLLTFSRFSLRICTTNRNISYVQGQSPDSNSREYFYFVDHQGMLFLDDSKLKNFTSCFKEKRFLQFFFRRLKLNDTGKYQKEFPFLSPCGKENNFVRCDDLPIVFTNILHTMNANDTEYLSYCYTGDALKIKFEPDKLCMLPESGRVYHPGPESTGGVGLIKSSFTIELSQNFIYKDKNNTDEMPISFLWNGTEYPLTDETLKKLKILKQRLNFFNP
ncbi:UPF0598 protein CG30010-like isoform X1 [Argiope bruennichi]|uniref:UPF0598 protein CG30010-like isoform X1 n=1 Tax=Argiope bruennichi TaxID=94029 RepID=UPI0024959511|nr:UPF0598 protein CG30010-like isoform X1 [Argiope bruennichi]